MPVFDKWWSDTKKHRKRLDHWLPHWKQTAERIGEERRMRYLTLCARPMIDVFLLVKEELLQRDPENHSIGSVQFCECDQEQFVEIKELIGREDAGFLGRIEEVVLFKDDDFTAQFPTPQSVDIKLDDERLQAETAKIDRLQLKRTFFNIKSSFPYDCVNLDFCQYYYPEPPDMLRINDTVERILDWQRRSSEDGEQVQLDEFILAVTCRHDAEFPPEAEGSLLELIRTNCAAWPEYKENLKEICGVAEIEEWVRNNKEDFFFAGWPKDIARAAREYGWAMKILEYVYYRRVGDEDNPYIIACLVAQFSRVNQTPNYSATALFALREENRKLIGDIDRNSPEGQELLEHLAEIVAVRNEQARRVERPELPDP